MTSSSTSWRLHTKLPINDLLLYHAHHADEVRLPWTPEEVAEARALVQDADAYQAPIDALVVWLARDPARHGPLLVDAVLGREHARRWTPSAVQPCPRCGYPATCARSHAGSPTEAVNELADDATEESHAPC